MADTTADVRRDIEMTRERMSDTIAQLEQKLNVSQIVRDHPWPAIALAVGAGVLLSGSSSDVRAAAATVAATKGASSKLGPALDDVVARFMQGVTAALNERVDHWVDEVKQAIGAPTGAAGAGGSHANRQGSAYDSAQSFGGGARSPMTTELRDSGDWAGNASGGARAHGVQGSQGTAGGQGSFGSQGAQGSQGASGNDLSGGWAPKYGESPRAD